MCSRRVSTSSREAPCAIRRGASPAGKYPQKHQRARVCAQSSMCSFPVKPSTSSPFLFDPSCLCCGVGFPLACPSTVRRIQCCYTPRRTQCFCRTWRPSSSTTSSGLWYFQTNIRACFADVSQKVIESTWQKGSVVASHGNLQGLRKIKLQGWESTFWRYQELGRQFLSTLEAIYYTSIECINAKQRFISLCE